MVSIVITRSPQFKPRSLSLHKTSQDYGLEGQRTISCMVILNLLMARTSLNSLIWNFTLIIPCGHHTWAPLLAAATAPAPPGSSSLPWAKLQESPLVQFPCAKYLQRMVLKFCACEFSVNGVEHPVDHGDENHKLNGLGCWDSKNLQCFFSKYKYLLANDCHCV